MPVAELDEVWWTQKRTNVRRGPGTKHQKLGQFAAGEEVGVTGEVAGGKWLRIDWAEGQHGYVYARLLVASAPSEETALPLKSACSTSELIAWAKVKASQRWSEVEAFLRCYPQGRYAEQALTKLEQWLWQPLVASKDAAAIAAYIEQNPRGGVPRACRTLACRAIRLGKGQGQSAVARYGNVFRSLPEGGLCEGSRATASGFAMAAVGDF